MKLSWKTQRLITGLGPWLLFGATLWTVALLYMDTGNQGDVVGFAEGEEAAIASMDAGRVAEVSVQLGQFVRKGEPVAVLESDGVDREIAVVDAEIARLQSEIDAGQSEQFRTRLLDREKLETSVEVAELALSREQGTLKRMKGEEAVLLTERRRLRRLVKQKLVTGTELSRVELRLARVAKEVETVPQTVAVLEQQLVNAQARLSEGEKGDVFSVDTKPLVKARKVAEKRRLVLQNRKDALVLKAPVDGQVTAVHHRPGEVVAAGEPIVSLVSVEKMQVVACVSEEDALSVSIRDKAQLWIRGTGGEPLHGTVISLGPLVDQVPVRCRKIPAQPAWGRDVVIRLNDPVDLLPGQAFDVRFEAGDGVEPGEAVASPRAERPIQEMEVPSSLRQLTRFEPSGLIWRDDLSRYVIVSDDTGHKGARNKTPWLFSMSLNGSVDPQPLPVEGVKAFNDLEGLTATESDDLYVLASQSYSRHGKRPKSRTLFARLKRSDFGYEAEQRVYLAKTLEEAGPETMNSLGLSGSTEKLEIEGISYKDGALFLGLKSPLDAEGRAMIWRIGQPDRLFDEASVEHAEFSLWARVKLTAKVGRDTVPGGISELLFLPNGTLVITSTPSMDTVESETGRLWWTELDRADARSESVGVLSVDLHRSFDGLKPEGMSVSPTPGHLAIVFDTGEQNPSWVEIPWPQ
jgi:multidrug resistance efflux pump